MLVLARQVNERILLPTVPATIEVVGVKPGGVRLGIEAPPEVPIVREEVFLRGEPRPVFVRAAANTDAEKRLAHIKHILRNRLHTLALGLDLLRQQLQDSAINGSDALIGRMEEEVRALDRQLKAALAEPIDEPPIVASVVTVSG